MITKNYSITVRHNDNQEMEQQTITIKDNKGILVAVVVAGRFGTTVELGLSEMDNYEIAKVKE